MNLELGVSTITVRQRRQGGRWRDCGVSGKVMYVDAQQGTRRIPHYNLGLSNRERIVLMQVARRDERLAVETDILRARVYDPNPFAARDRDGRARGNPR
jgi:hypothetical protein